ncbi:hypothetical protein PR048_002807 [Dryococelus australis]|uniref:Uncharacterized protein n=1 Tax=Dryococelus australis TaxID=614101 RepID=A0ABQ9ILA5_9NEOP|nr:hypothetical protein PR048_002807 [Dryococelus australis]
MVCGNEPSQRAPGVITGKHVKPESEWPGRIEPSSRQENMINPIRKISAWAWRRILYTARHPREDLKIRNNNTTVVIEFYLTTSATSTTLLLNFAPFSLHSTSSLRALGEAATERLARSPPTKAKRVQSPAGSLRIFACRNRTGRCRWSAGFLGDLPFPRPSFRRCSILTSITLIGSQGLAVKSHQNLFTHSAYWWSGEIWVTRNTKVLRADEGEVRWIWSSARILGRGKREVSEETRRPVAMFGKMPTGEKQATDDDAQYLISFRPFELISPSVLVVMAKLRYSYNKGPVLEIPERPPEMRIASARFVARPDARGTPSRREPVADLSRRVTRGVYQGPPLPIREEAQPSATMIKVNWFQRAMVADYYSSVMDDIWLGDKLQTCREPLASAQLMPSSQGLITSKQRASTQHDVPWACAKDKNRSAV